MNCGYGEKMILYLYGEAGERVKDEVESHLPSCPACRAELDALRAADAHLSAEADGPSPWVVTNVMREARSAVSRRRGFSFRWGEALLSGALASLLAFVFAVSDRGTAPDMAWNSFDPKLESLEYSLYQTQSDMTSSSYDWEYGISALEDESLALSKNVQQV